jgi:hypothetical protein
MCFRVLLCTTMYVYRLISLPNIVCFVLALPCLVLSYLFLPVAVVFRMFQPAGVPGLMQARLRRTSLHTREFHGFSHAEQGHWGDGFAFSLVQDPLFGQAAGEAAAGGIAGGEGGGWAIEEARLRAVITGLNKLRPRFVVVSGNLTAAAAGEGPFEAQLEAARRCLCRVSETTPLLFVPGPHSVGKHPSPQSLEFYNSKFGADYFGFFYGGFRCLVINSSLMIHSEHALEQAAKQDLWFAEEIEQSKLHATHIAIFAHHPWFLRAPAEADSEADGTFPLLLRERWLPMMRHSKIKYLFCSAVSAETPGAGAGAGAVSGWESCGGLVNKRTAAMVQQAESEAAAKRAARATRRVVRHSAADEAYVMKTEGAGQGAGQGEGQGHGQGEGEGGEPLKPSEVVSQSRAVQEEDSSSEGEGEGEGEGGKASDDEELTKEEEVGQAYPYA